VMHSQSERQMFDKILNFACSGMFSDFTDGFFEVGIWNNFLNTGTRNVFGKVRTVVIEEKVTDDENLSVGLPFLTSLSSGDVLVVKGSSNFAYFGELMANLAERVGVMGTVVFGASRDTKAITRLNYPLFAQSFTPVDIKGRGRVEAVDQTFSVDNFKISPGDWIFADSDGLVVFKSKDADAIFRGVSGLIDSEKIILKQISEGLSGDELANLHNGF